MACLSKDIQDFIHVNNWMDKKYKNLSARRYPTIKAALNLFYQREGKTIVETGCARLKDDWGAGLSTMLFAETLDRHGGYLWSVDISEQNLVTCAEIILPWSTNVTLTCQDSVEFLKSLYNRSDFSSRKIDLLYLDSFVYPYGPILDHFGGQNDVNKAIIAAEESPEHEILAQFEMLVAPCQEHTVQEFYAALPNLHDKSIVLIDENDLAGGGKSRLVRQELYKSDWECIIDDAQSLWLKK